MMSRFLSRVFSSRPVKLLLVLGVLLLLASQAIPQIVDTKPCVEKIAASVRETSGATLMVKGSSQLQILPRPALVFTSAEISQPHVEGAPSVTAELAELDLDVLSLLTPNPRVSGVRASGVSLVAERLPGGGANWGFLGLPLLKSLSLLKPEHTFGVTIISGRATIGDAKTGETYGISELNTSGSFGNDAILSGSFMADKTPVHFSATRSGSVGATPITVILTGNGHSASLKGSMDFTGASPVITAKLDVATDISSFAGAASATSVASPLKLSADYAQKEGLVALSNMSLEALNSKAVGDFQWDTSKRNDYKLILNFSTLDWMGVKQLAGAYLSSINAQQDKYGTKTLADKSLTIKADITADIITNGTQSWKKAVFDGAVAEGVLTVNKLAFALPGDSNLSLFGLVSVSDTQGLRFEGNTEASGSSLRDLLTVFDESAANLPALGFGAYSLRSNLFISKELLRLSEADAKFSELALKGGLVAYFDKKPRIESDVALRDINFDYFRDSWRTTAAASDKDNKDAMFLRFDRDMNFDWLKKLSASVDFKVSVQDFTFLERRGKTANFRLFAQAGELGIYNAKFVYPDDTTEANLKLDVTREQPILNLVLNTATLNTNYFALNPHAPEPVAASVPAPAMAKMAAKPAEPLPEMAMPDATTPEEELRQKIQEEAATMHGADVAATAATPALPASPVSPAAPASTSPAQPAPDAQTVTPKITLVPENYEDDTPDDTAEPPSIEMKPQTWLRKIFISEAFAQEATLQMPTAPTPTLPQMPPAPPADIPDTEMGRRWAAMPIDMSLMEGIGGTFDISVGKLQHESLVFDNFKMLAKLERNLLTFQTLTFMHWGGSFSINGTLFGGKVPGLSLGFIIASVDVKQMLSALLHIDSITGRASISGTVDTSGLNMLSWISQASGKLLMAGRGVTIRGFDMPAALGAVTASRTAADVFNNVNMALVNGTGDYSADGAINIAKGMISSPGISLKTGRITGTMSGDFRLIPWDLNLSGNFKFPELSTENVPTMNVRVTGAVEKPELQTDTQSLEAFVSKRITGN